MIEAKIAHNKAIIAIEEKLQAKPQKKKEGLFRYWRKLQIFLE